MAIAPIAITATPAAEIGDREDALTTASTSAAAPSTLLSPTPAALPSPKATPKPPPPWLTSIPSSGEPLAYRTAVTPSTSCGPPPPPPPENGPPRGDYSAAVHRVPAVAFSAPLGAVQRQTRRIALTQVQRHCAADYVSGGALRGHDCR